MPNFADTARRIRDDLGLTRDDVTAISRSHLARLEGGTKPTENMVDHLVTAYDADEDLTRHLRELSSPPDQLEADSVARTRIAADPTLRNQLDHLNQRGVLGAYVDPLWNVLFANTAFRETFTSIDELRSLTLWIFSQTAEQILLDIDHERGHTVACLRAAAGRFRESPLTSKLLRRLIAIPEFERRWSGPIHVEYGRPLGDLIHARDPSGQPTSYRIGFTDWIPPHRVQLITAERLPYSGPPAYSA
ncbi:helix-turn-helix domain-containing protein, partial [Nocardia sp. NPDC058497]|uniref:MmyB family transcriptional regulator n=1 Tax=Nocardia sp. NPDC058497 TaxID=3346529 RepID=UPI0036578B6C